MSVKGINQVRVSEWFDSHVAGAQSPFDFELITGGHSNLTFRVTDSAGSSFVLRRPPTGAVIATAHDMAREHRIISALQRTDVPVPPTLGLCEEIEVNDAPFYVMDYVEGLFSLTRPSPQSEFSYRNELSWESGSLRYWLPFTRSIRRKSVWEIWDERRPTSPGS